MMMPTEIFNAGGNDDEPALVAEVRSGNTTCFETLMRRHERKMFRVAKNITKNDSDAEGVTQEAFLKAFVHIEDFNGESRFSTWLVRITVNQALMNLRKRRPNQFSLDDPIETEEISVRREIKDWRPTPEAMYSRNELAEILSRTIAELHPPLRVIFQLRDVESLSAEETANHLRISVPAVKSRHLRARLALREKLNRFIRNQFTRNGVQCSTALFCGASRPRDIRRETSLRIGML
jgi:RNA polymerase sigma-70 factor, ECF subfamily